MSVVCDVLRLGFCSASRHRRHRSSFTSNDDFVPLYSMTNAFVFFFFFTYLSSSPVRVRTRPTVTISVCVSYYFPPSPLLSFLFGLVSVMHVSQLFICLSICRMSFCPSVSPPSIYFARHLFVCRTFYFGLVLPVNVMRWTLFCLLAAIVLYISTP